MPVRSLGETCENALRRIESCGRLERAGQGPRICDAIQPERPVLADLGLRARHVPTAGVDDEPVRVQRASARRPSRAVYLIEIGLRWRIASAIESRTALSGAAVAGRSREGEGAEHGVEAAVRRYERATGLQATWSNQDFAELTTASATLAIGSTGLVPAIRLTPPLRPTTAP